MIHNHRHKEYNDILSQIPKPTETPEFQYSGKLMVCLVEFRDMPEIDWVINALLRVYPSNEIGFSIVCGTRNYASIHERYGHWLNIQIIKEPHENLSRGTYSALLKQPQFWERFLEFSHVLIYQTDACIFRKIDDVYFKYDYIGAPWKSTNQCGKFNAGNGGFSLRNVKAMISCTKGWRNTNFNQIHRGNEDIYFCGFDNLSYPECNTEEHKAFAVERVAHKSPVGCHQLYLCWDIHEEEWQEFKKYMLRSFGMCKESEEVNDKEYLKTFFSDVKYPDIKQFTENSIKNVVDDTPDVEFVKVEKSTNSSQSTSMPVKVEEILQTTQIYGAYYVKLDNKTVNKWEVSCNGDYDVLFTNTGDIHKIIENPDKHIYHKQSILSKDESVIHKKDKGVTYFEKDNMKYLIFYPGFPNGSESHADIHAPWGNNISKNRKLPINGAVVLRTSAPKIDKTIIKVSESEESKLGPPKSSGEPHLPKVNDSAFLSKYNLGSIKSNILVYELFTGVGFYNQLFSLELGIFLARLYDRHLVLNVRHPLVHCGKPDWDNGILLNYLDKEAYMKLLPKGLTVRTRHNVVSCDIGHKLQLPCKASNIVFVEEQFMKDEAHVKEFAHFRTIIPMKKMDDLFGDPSRRVVCFDKSNASRFFYNFLVNEERVKLMNEIAEGLTKVNPIIDAVCDYIKVKEGLLNIHQSLGLHFRFGDCHKSKEHINGSNSIIEKNTTRWLNKRQHKDCDLLIMCDRSDNDYIHKLQKEWKGKVILVDSYFHKDSPNSKKYKTLLKEKFKNTQMAEFLIQRLLLGETKRFIGSQGSTVSVHIQYTNYIQDKPYEYYTHSRSTAFDNDQCKFPINKSKNFGWSQRNYIGGHPVSWSCFFETNVAYEE